MFYEHVWSVILEAAPDLRRYHDSLSPRRRSHLTRLAQLYMSLSCRYSPVYLGSTERYGSRQVCVKARYPIKPKKNIIAI